MRVRKIDSYPEDPRFRSVHATNALPIATYLDESILREFLRDVSVRAEQGEYAEDARVQPSRKHLEVFRNSQLSPPWSPI